jgi:cytoskeletal protein CcmA (bactofilin family)
MSPPTQPVLEIHSGIVLKGRLSMVKDVVLTGKFEGDLQTFGCLTVASGGMVTGTIDAGALVLEQGNLVEARVKVGPPPKLSVKIYEETKKKAVGGFWSGRFQKLKEMAFGRR